MSATGISKVCDLHSSSLPAVRHGGAARRAVPASLLVSLLASLVLTTGCAERHSVEVGAMPDDYRTRHPIIVGESEEAIEIPVASSESRLPRPARDRVTAFATRFQRSGSTAIRVMVPSGSQNAAAATLAAHDVERTLHAAGVGKGRVFLVGYAADGASGPTPLRVSFATLKARTERCGRWPEDLGDTSENRNYFNFGCATQQNLAAQIADPRDLLEPRGMSEIDAGRRTTVLEDYRRGADTASSSRASEVNYDF